MPHLIIAPRARADLRRMSEFLRDKNPRAAERATQAIRREVGLLATAPALGRPVDDSNLRELVVPFSDGGYVVLYRYDPDVDAVVITAIRHQKEAGY